MKVNHKLDTPLLICGIVFILLGLIYKSRDLLPVELTELFFLLPPTEDRYYKLVESDPEFKFGLLFFILGIAVLIFRRIFIQVKSSGV
jgi:hypothetical protein